MKSDYDKNFENEIKEINKIMDKILNDFNVEVPYLSRPIDIEEAENLYKYIKDNNIRDKKMY